MKYLDEFRDPAIARKLLNEIRDKASRPHVLMEVCGGQTHSLLRHGIDDALQGFVELIHGPGCPVCVTSAEAIDFAQKLSLQPNVVLTSFGDMIRVPGSSRSLLEVRGMGGKVRIVYSPMDAIELAKRQPDQHVVFFAVGFETTVPATALAVLQAAQLGLDNFSLLVSHVRVLPAMEALVQARGCRVEGFLAAGHVCTVTGFTEYEDFVCRYHRPVVVTGFEPVDLLAGILDCVSQLESGRFEVTNQYGRNVRRDGNESAQEMVCRVYKISDTPWRGLGIIPSGGYRLRPEFSHFDAEQRFAELFRDSGGAAWGDSCLALPTLGALASFANGECLTNTCSANKCRSGEVLIGQIKPVECAAFGKRCTPDSPLGAPMVSAEGACAAYFRYQHSM